MFRLQRLFALQVVGFFAFLKITCSMNRTKLFNTSLNYHCEREAMNRIKLPIITVIVVVLLACVIGTIMYYNGLSSKSNSTAIPTPEPTPTSTPKPTPKIPPNSTSIPTTSPNSKLTVTYLELSRNESMIVIEFKLEPNSYIFQLNATSFYLTQDSSKISANINDVVIIGTQYSTLFFPIDNFKATDYQLSSKALPSDAVWIRN